MAEPTEKEIAAVRARLEARLEELKRARQSGAEDRKPVALDQTSVGRLSRMDAMQVHRSDEARMRQAADGLKARAGG